ncbi:hypothetical protein JMF97_29455 [Micromonospora fiedleri]|uniref:Uncharacterized protein n=1 Tax=Micromonospora fiedleri TaxID=1157498 RepID=A0ABS1UVA3_9ACTN|nr:hypothetical protein [Micromonospora fiedleri]MBL6280295.1 hypothetical protein [Micromonospora fiedleri]
MESDGSVHRIGPQEARRALAEITDGRAVVAGQAVAPWWYHPGMGASLLWAFAAVSVGWAWIPYGVIIGLLLGPLLLNFAANHATGVSLDRYHATPAARRISVRAGMALPVLIVLGLALEWGADLRGSMAACGVVMLVITIVAGRRIDAALVHELGRPA